MRIRPHLITMTESSYVQTPRVVDCALGTNPYGPPPSVRGIFPNERELSEYPDEGGYHLREELACYWAGVANLSRDQFITGAGSFDILERINRVFIGEGDTVLGIAPQFADYRATVLACGGEYDCVRLGPMDRFRFRLDTFLSRLRRGCRMVYLDNPNNPTGQVIPIDEIDAVARAAEKLGICLLVDEAYGEFMPKENSALTLVNRYDHVAVVRSFSKGFGLAGMRVGYMAAGDAILNAYAKVNHPFVVNSHGLRLAEAALRDKTHIADTTERIAYDKKLIRSRLSKLTCAETADETPIFMLEAPRDIDLAARFRAYGVRPCPLTTFGGLSQRHVRLRIPAAGLDELLLAIDAIEAEM